MDHPDTPDGRRLGTELTIYTAGETRARLLEWLGDPADGAEGPLAVDASAVAEIDAAGVQLLASLARSLAGQSRTLRLDRPSDALHDACTRLGLATLLPAGACEGTPA